MRSLQGVALFAVFGLIPAFLVAQSRQPFAVELKAVQPISSADAACGQVVLFSTIKTFDFEGHSFPKGTLATGKLVTCTESGRAGRGGTIKIQLDSLQLPDGETFPLSGVALFHGGSRTLGMLGGATAVGLLVSPFVAPVALLLRGKSAVMPAGSIVVATIEPKPLASAAPKSPLPQKTDQDH